MPHPPVRCGWCEKTHPATLLCDPARKALDAMVARGRSHDMPGVEFDELVYVDAEAAFGFGPDSRLFRQIVVKATLVEVLDVPRGAIVITGLDANGATLPQWVYIGDDDELAAAAKLFADVAAMAIRGARAARGEDGR